MLIMLVKYRDASLRHSLPPGQVVPDRSGRRTLRGLMTGFPTAALSPAT